MPTTVFQSSPPTPIGDIHGPHGRRRGRGRGSHENGHGHGQVFDGSPAMPCASPGNSIIPTLQSSQHASSSYVVSPEYVSLHQDMEARTFVDIDGLLDTLYEVQDLDNEGQTRFESTWQTMTQRPARNVNLRSDRVEKTTCAII